MDIPMARSPGPMSLDLPDDLTDDRDPSSRDRDGRLPPSSLDLPDDPLDRRDDARLPESDRFPGDPDARTESERTGRLAIVDLSNKEDQMDRSRRDPGAAETGDPEGAIVQPNEPKLDQRESDRERADDDGFAAMRRPVVSFDERDQETEP